MAAHPTVHPSEDTLRAFALGKLDDTASSALMSHLDGCLDCCQKVATMTNDDFLIRLRHARGPGPTTAPAQTLAETARNVSLPPGPTTLFNAPPELADHPEYEVLRELGRGGMGIVYQARHRLSGRIEVLKVMNKALLEQPGSKERFLREIQAAARLDHKNVVKMYTALERGDLMILVMEYVPGVDLAQVIKARGPLPVLYACYYVQQAAAGLQHAFEKGMVHRDIKPQNLILVREGRKHVVKILDFGLAKATRGEDESQGLTGSGAMMGTPSYIAPEQSLDAAVADIHADIYSLGCTLYHLLAGAPPFTGRSEFEIMQAHHTAEARPLNLVRLEVPAALAAVVRQMMAKKAAERYQTPIEVVRALEPFVRGEMKPLPAAPPPVIAKTMIEGPATIAKGGAKRLPPTVVVRPRRAATVRERTAKNQWLMGCGIGAGMILMLLLGMWIGGVFKERTPEKGEDASARATASPPPTRPTPVKTSEKSDSSAHVTASPPPTRPTPVKILEKSKDISAHVIAPAPPTRPTPVKTTEKSKDTSEKKPAELPSSITNSIGMKLVLVKPGTFVMGSPASEMNRENDEEQHEVEITRTFYVGVYEVTQEHYERIMGKNPSWFSSTGVGKNRVRDMDTRQFPVDNVSWKEAVEFCRLLSIQPEEKSNGRMYRLPTEAEWEYIYRGGPFFKKPSPPFSFGNSLSSTQANFDGNFPYGGAPEGPCLVRTQKVGSYPANPLGLYDLHGNVWEWCADWYQARYYKESPKKDPQGPEKGERRVVRGGAWCNYGRICRSAFRNLNAPGIRNNYIGFRVVLVLAARKKS